MRKMHNITVIFIIVINVTSSQLTYASENLCLRMPIRIDKERMSVAEDFFVPGSAKSLELRKTMLHDIKNISEVINKLLYDEKVHSEDFNKAKNSLFLYIGKLYEILDSYNNVNWESYFKNTFNEFISNFNDNIVKILCKELDEERSNDLKDFIAGMKFFYKSFVGNDPIKDVDLENLFKIVKVNEADFPFIIFNFKSQETAKHIIGKEGEIYRSFLNLVRNGVEAIERKTEEIGYPKAFDFKGCIEINVYSDKGYSVIEISDNGSGMPNEALEAFRNHTVYSSKGELGGRGLKASRNIIERNNGTIDVQSKLGRGTTFTIRLPVPGHPLLFAEKEIGFKVIFLDIDGVLNSYDYMDTLYLEGKRTTIKEKSVPAIDPEAVENLRLIVEKTGAKIVIISNWRSKGLQWIREFWKQNQLPGDIIDITSELDNRLAEMREWLKNKHVRSYIVLDDDLSDIESQEIGNVIKVHPKYGLRDSDVQKAVQMMNSRDIISGLYGRENLTGI